MGLLDSATVLRGDGPWSNGYDMEGSECGLAVRIGDICTPTPVNVVGDPTGTPSRVSIKPFGVDAVLGRDVRCALDSDLRRVDLALESSQERAIGYAFDLGAEADWESPHLHHADVEVITGADAEARVGSALERYYAKSASPALLHLGIGSAIRIMRDMEDILEMLGVTVVISPGYDSKLVAVTGPVTVRIGTSEVVQVYDSTNNRTEIQATEVAAIEFDMCIAVRADQS
jgi:hypothetical protein